MLESKRLPKSPGHYSGGGEVICQGGVCGRTHVHLGKGLSHYSRRSCGFIEVVQQVIILLQKFVIGQGDGSGTTPLHGDLVYTWSHGIHSSNHSEVFLCLHSRGVGLSGHPLRRIGVALDVLHPDILLLGRISLP